MNAVAAVKPVVFNPLDPALIEDPYPIYAALRAAEPVHHSPLGIVVVTGRAQVEALLMHPALTSDVSRLDPSRFPFVAGQSPFFREIQPKMLLGLDGLDHKRLRRLLVKAFTPKSVARIADSIAALVDDLLPPSGGRFDFMESFARPLPAVVICELLGIPEADRPACVELSNQIAALFDLFPDPAKAAAGDAALREFAAYMTALVDHRRAHPEDALLDDFIAASEDDDSLTNEEVVINASLLFGAGHETTTNLLGNGMLALLRTPSQMALLAARPELAANAVSEMLRYDSAVQMVPRFTTEEVEIGGVVIEPEVPVALILGAANRDPAFYSEPDRFDIERENPRPLSFGKGAHFCIGAALARLEGELAFAAIARRAETIRIAEPPRHRRHANFRGLEALVLEG